MSRHTARVLIDEARKRRHQPAFHATLLRWAANARRRSGPVQRDLFGAPAA